MRILLIDDHLLFREALSLMLGQLEGDVTCVYAGTGAEARAACEFYGDLSLILVDLALPDTDGIDLLSELRGLVASVPIVVVSASEEPERVRAALLAGARGYLPKASSGPELIAAMRSVLAGSTYVPTALLSEMGDLLPKSPPAAPGGDTAPEAPLLTARQYQVLRLLRDGAPNKLIARKLNLSEGTVKLHVSAAIQLLGAKNRTEAVALANKRGLFTETSGG